MYRMYDCVSMIRGISAVLEAVEVDRAQQAAEEASSCRSAQVRTESDNLAVEAPVAGVAGVGRVASSLKAYETPVRAMQQPEADTRMVDTQLEAGLVDQALRPGAEGRSSYVCGHSDPIRRAFVRFADRGSSQSQHQECCWLMRYPAQTKLPYCPELAWITYATVGTVGGGSVGRLQGPGRRAERSSRALACSIRCPRWLRGLVVRGEQLSTRLLFPSPFSLPGIVPRLRRCAFASHQPFSTQPARPLESVHDLGLSRV